MKRNEQFEKELKEKFIMMTDKEREDFLIKFIQSKIGGNK